MSGGSDPTSEVFDAVHAAVVSSARAFGPRAVELIRTRIDAPGGAHDHSRRGEAPRRVSGGLYDSIDYLVNDDAAAGVTTLYPHSDARHAPVLEFDLDRPFLSTALQDLAPAFMDHLARDLRDALGS